MHPIYARLLHMLLVGAAVDTQRVLAAAALDWDTLLKSEQHLSKDTVIRLVCAAIQATNKPWLGLELGGQMPISAHGPLGYAAVTAPDLQHCLAAVARYGAVREDSFAWTFQKTPDGYTLQAAAKLDWGDAHTFVVDTMAAALVRLLQAAVGTLPNGLRLDLPMATPAWAAQYARALPLALRFDQPLLALHTPAAALRLACLGADARAHAAASQECEATLQERGTQSAAQRVANLLSGTPEGHYPQLADIAKSCGTSERTLIRHLAQEGSSFQQLLDAHLQSRARWLLHNTSYSVEEIAARLGYSDTSNFSRTVKRWFGLTPTALRLSIDAA
jgi:AraC-like DNA-binding protein